MALFVVINKRPLRGLFVIKPKSLGKPTLNSRRAVLIVAMRQPCWVDDFIGVGNELCNNTMTHQSRLDFSHLYISTCVPNSITRFSGKLKYLRLLLAFFSRKANRLSRHRAIPIRLVGTTVSRLRK